MARGRLRRLPTLMAVLAAGAGCVPLGSSSIPRAQPDEAAQPEVVGEDQSTDDALNPGIPGDNGSSAAESDSSTTEVPSQEPLDGRPARAGEPELPNSDASGDTTAGGGRESAVDRAPDLRRPADVVSVEWTAGDPESLGAWARTTLSAMSLPEKVGQMMMPRVLGDFTPEGSEGHDRMARLVNAYGIGGVILSVGSPMDAAVKLNDLQRHSTLPLLVAADLESGAGFRLRGAVHLPSGVDLGGATSFPSLMALGAAGDPRLAWEVGRVTAVEARAIGIHIPFAPVLDVNNNPDNPVINVRSFGEDPGRVAEMGSALVRGLQEHGAVATGKHFPGHGDTEVDSHLALPVIRVDRQRVDSVELKPFRAAIDAGMAAIMTAHIAVPELTDGRGVPATLAAPVLTDLLRTDLGFRGLVFTDAMDMYAIARRFSRQEAAVRAVEAGADVVLMPPDVGAAIDGIVSAVEEGRLSEERIDRSVRRILGLKERLGLARRRTVDVEAVPHYVGIPEHARISDEIARASITLARNERDLLPLRGTRNANVLSVTYRRRNDLLAGRAFDGHLRETYRRLRREAVDRSTEPAVYTELLGRARRSDLVVISLYVSGVTTGDEPLIPEELVDFVRQVRVSGVPHVVISFGNPYLVSEFPSVRAYLLAWSGAEASQVAAAAALLGEIDIRGRTPTSIAPLLEIGEGLQLPRKGARP